MLVCSGSSKSFISSFFISSLSPLSSWHGDDKRPGALAAGIDH